MNATDPHLDLTRLEKVRHTGNKLVARCPSCAIEGGDRRGEHLFVNLATRKWGCAARAGDHAHRQEIFTLIGIRGEHKPDPERERAWRQEREEERRRESADRSLVDSARARRDSIIARHEWTLADVWDDSPQRIEEPLVEYDPRHFLGSLLSRNALIWAGEVYHSGNNHADKWRTVAEWQESPHMGPMLSPATWKPGTVSRTAENVESAPYVVLDFDGFDGQKPVSNAEVKKHVADSLAIVRWLREGQRWQLAAIIWTGGKSVHAWFRNPGSEPLQSLRTTASALGIDPGLIGRAEHPCRLPGQTHAKTGHMSRTLWLQIPTDQTP